MKIKTFKYLLSRKRKKVITGWHSKKRTTKTRMRKTRMRKMKTKRRSDVTAPIRNFLMF